LARTAPAGIIIGMASTSATTATLPATVRLGAVHLTVTDLDRSARFYEEAIGLEAHRRDGREAALGAGGRDLVVLVEEPEARPAGRHAGLYHFALLNPSRLELARAAQRLIATGTPISGASDHGVSEAIYLPDPDGNGIELAADRPRERWGDGSEVQASASGELAVGHLHLHVGDIERALGFWRDLIGFEVMTRFSSAAFISAGGYHHHLGLNTWRGEGVPPAPDGTVGLRHWTIVLEQPAQVAEVRERLARGAEVEELPGGFLTRDPYGNPVRLVAEAG
jgi:catechol 2,3-dioxygenase